jgi:hypothetical protein
MSSSNLVRVSFIEEATLGETPVAGDFETVRFTSESLSGTPTTTQSQQIRSDRMSSGQIAVGLEVAGEINFELAKDAGLEKFMESAMLNEWDTQASQVVDLEIDSVAKTISRASGDFNATLDVGDIISLLGFSNSVNNTQAQVVAINSALEIKVVFNEANGAVVDEVGSGTSYKRADRLQIGANKKSFTMEKAFLDLADKALIYKGQLANTLSLNIAYGEIVTGTVGFNGTKYQAADSAVEFATNGRSILQASTTNAFNGSIDMPFVNSSSTGVLDEATFCIQSASLSLNNNMQAQTCIGEAAPKDYSPGEASIEVSLSAYLADENWNFLAKKLTQEPFALGFMVKNAGGFYGFYLPAIQTTFSDPASGGANQQISIEMTGTAKVGENGESALYIYRG